VRFWRCSRLGAAAGRCESGELDCGSSQAFAFRRKRRAWYGCALAAISSTGSRHDLNVSFDITASIRRCQEPQLVSPSRLPRARAAVPRLTRRSVTDCRQIAYAHHDSHQRLSTRAYRSQLKFRGAAGWVAYAMPPDSRFLTRAARRMQQQRRQQLPAAAWQRASPGWGPRPLQWQRGLRGRARPPPAPP